LNALSLMISLSCAGLLSGCAATVPAPSELQNARQAYARASMNPGAQLVPADLQKARAALGNAEQSFRDDPASHRTRDLADHASREARIAELNASTASDSAAAADEKHRASANDR
jgi:hypothetical protein